MGLIMNRFAREVIESELKKKYGEKPYEEMKKRLTASKVRLRYSLNETSFVSRGNTIGDYETMTESGENLLVANKDGVFEKRSKFGEKGRVELLYDEYNMLFRDGSFNNVIVKNGQVQSVIVEDKYGLFRELTTLPDVEQEGVMDRIFDVMEVMIDEDVLLG